MGGKDPPQKPRQKKNVSPDQKKTHLQIRQTEKCRLSSTHTKKDTCLPSRQTPKKSLFTVLPDAKKKRVYRLARRKKKIFTITTNGKC